MPAKKKKKQIKSCLTVESYQNSQKQMAGKWKEYPLVQVKREEQFYTLCNCHRYCSTAALLNPQCKAAEQFNQITLLLYHTATSPLPAL